MLKTSVKIGSQMVGEKNPTFIVAEMSANHNGDFEKAKKIIYEAKRAGADAIKLQTYTEDTMTIDSKKKYFKIGKGTLWEGRNLYDLYKEAHTPWEWHGELKALAEELGLNFFSTPFDNSALDFLEDLGVDFYKIASFEIVDLPLLERIGKTKKPIIMSTGMATLGEIEDALEAIRNQGNEEIILLKCTSAYPAPYEEMNLKTIPNLSNTFGVPTGLSDHSMGIEVPLAAVALGACVIEKHFTLSRKDKGPDSAFSLEPEEFSKMVAGVRKVEKSLGKIDYHLTEKEKNSRVFRRSLFVVHDIKEGEKFTKSNLRSIRPGYGLPPKYLKEILGKRALENIERGTPLRWEMVGK